MRVFDVAVDLPDGERITFRTTAPQPGPPLPRQIFLQLAALTLVLAGVLYVMTRSITRPLSALAVAADQIGRGAPVLPLAERGASEVRDATRAFNTMQDRLRRYLDSRTRVLAAMSHDLRTPLTRLRLRAESIDDDELRERVTAELDDMTEMVRGALSMFRDLNDTEATIPVDINELLSTLREEFAELDAIVTITGRADRPILAKPHALKRCLTNLLRNAVDYGIRAHVAVCDDPVLTIRIRDEGPGIPVESLEQVFEPFYRIESSRNRDTGGTGLGLSIARDIAQAHGGTIHLTNLPDRGLEVVLKLPR
jgi:signal transduction histidine kinase